MGRNIMKIEGLPVEDAPRSLLLHVTKVNVKNGTIKGPATDELFMREYIREWKRLMKAEPDIAIRREP